MKITTIFLILISFLWVTPSFSGELSCQHIYHIQKRFLKNHILYTETSLKLKNRSLNQFIKNLDRDKVYFLQSDIFNIKRKTKNFFKDLKKQKCNGLFFIYDTYVKRVQERIDFANSYLNDDFSFNKNLKYTLDDDLKRYPKTKQEANQKMKTYIQYQVANGFLFEKDLKKSVNQVSYIFTNLKKQVLSWKPQLNRQEKRTCKTKSKDSFKVCKPTKWFSKYLNSYSQSLDSHSSYFDKDDLEEFKISMNLQLEGIGATLSSRFGYTVVERLIPSGAAARSKKIKVKDKILAVGQNRQNLVKIFGERIEDVVSIIRGKKGTPVFLKISRDTKKDKQFISVVKIIRDRVDLKEEAASISYHKIKKNHKTHTVALLKIPSFYRSDDLSKSVTRDVRKLLNQAKLKSVQSLVLDLSNNRGGALDEAVDLSGLFFAKGNVVKQSERNTTKAQILKDRDQRVIYAGPLVVLVNRLSASASEIVGGTLQDYERALIVGGDHTFGKGSVQSVEGLFSSLGALKTTVGLYFIPSGKSTQKTGIISDIPFPSLFNVDELGEKNLDYVLPSKTIKSFKSPATDIFSKNLNENWLVIDPETISKLKKSSQKRISKNKEFKKITKQFLNIQEKTKNKKIITIGEVLENKDKDEDKDADALSQTPEATKKKYFQRPDVKEALQIAIELAIIQNHKL